MYFIFAHPLKAMLNNAMVKINNWKHSDTLSFLTNWAPLSSLYDFTKNLIIPIFNFDSNKSVILSQNWHLSWNNSLDNFLLRYVQKGGGIWSLRSVDLETKLSSCNFSQKPNEWICFSILTTQKHLKLEIEIQVSSIFESSR